MKDHGKVPGLGIELGKDVRGKTIMRIEKMQSQSKPEKGQEVLPTPTPFNREKVVELAIKSLASMLKIRLSEIGENTYTNRMEISIVEVKEKMDDCTGHAYAYCIDFCVIMDYSLKKTIKNITKF